MSSQTGPGATGSDLRAAVVGGGVIGVCCAYYLAKRGAQVSLLERDQIGRGASYGNAGLVSPGHPSINRPGRTVQALRSLQDPLSPLYIEPRWDPALARWLWSFSRHCSQRHVEYSMGALAPLGRATAGLFEELVDGEALDCGFTRCGYLELFASEAGLASGRKEAELVTRHGFATQELTGPAVRERESAVGDGVVGGWFHPEGMIVNPYRFVLEMADRAARRGATLRTGIEIAEVVSEKGRVRGVRTAAGELVQADAVVLATGAYSPDLLRKLGCPLPVQPAKGYHCDRDPRTTGTPTVQTPCLLGERAIFCSPMDEFVRFAGTLEFSGLNHVIRRDRLVQLTRGAAEYLVGVGEAESLSEWCGLRPCTPDGLPVVGRLPGYMGAFVATGHAMLGLTLGPITGQIIAELVTGGAPSFDIRALRPGRFPRRRPA